MNRFIIVMGCAACFWGVSALAQEKFPIQILTKPVGALVSIDGVSVGATPLEVPVTPGSHSFSIKADGFEPQTENVTTSNKPATFFFSLRPIPKESTLRIFTNADPAEILIDGVSVGQSPISLSKVAPGPHILSAVKIGYNRSDQEINVLENEVKVLSIPLSVPAATTAKLRVVTATPDAEVFLDGTRIGKAPVELNDLVPGTHFVVVRKDGFAEFSKEIKTSQGEGAEVIAVLSPLARLRVEGAPRGASFYVDGQLVGTAPEDGSDALIEKISVGSHQLIVRHPTIEPYEAKFEIQAGEKLVIYIDSTPQDQPLSPKDVAHARAIASSFGANPLPPGSVALSGQLGYPFFLGTWSARVGVVDKLDAGVQVRSFGTLTELGATGRYQLASFDKVSLGVEGSVGFGFGPTSTADFYFEGAGVMSANLIDPLTASLKVSGQILADSSSRPEYLAATGSDSQALARFNVGLGLSYQLSKDVSLEGILEASPAQEPRHLFEIEPLSGQDPTVYGRFGVTYKF